MYEVGEFKLKIPQTGKIDFKEIRDGNYYFVDKSELISDIINDGNGVYLFTRPRRFGKTLNLSMIDAFFNMNYKGNTWFDDLKVSEHENCIKLKNTFPVISISMKDMDVEDFNEFLSDFSQKISSLFGDFNYLADSDKIDFVNKDLFMKLWTKTSNKSELKNSLLILCKIIELYHGVKPIVLIDEYDNPINSSFNKNAYEQILSFMKGFYSSVLKDNTHMSFAVVTGIMQIAKESIFSGLNNLRVNNIFTEKFDERYGFTESEVKEICEYYGHPEKFAEAKEWYDGYRFGNAEIYNPWSIFFYVSVDFKPGTYWAGTSGNDIIDTLIDNATDKIYSDLVDLANDKTVIAQIKPTVAMKEVISNPSVIYSVMAVSGYLNAIPREFDYVISIPNNELRNVFGEMMAEHVHKGSASTFKKLFVGFERNDMNLIKGSLTTILDDNIPFILLSKEKDYQLIIGSVAMSSEGKYEVYLEKESGNGRADIIMKPRRSGLPSIIIELKKSRAKKDMQAYAERALSQIREKDYFRSMKGKILIYGICFNGKNFEIASEEINNQLD